jgi:hypothetical protein
MTILSYAKALECNKQDSSKYGSRSQWSPHNASAEMFFKEA